MSATVVSFNGAQLTGAKRNLFEDIGLDQLSAEERHQRRRAAIVRLYAKGVNLPKNLLEEISDLIPSNRSLKYRLTSEAYPHTRVHYAGIYGYNEHNIKKWIGLGRKIKPFDLPPLDEPRAMIEWWERMRIAGLLKQKVPPRLRAAAGQVPSVPSSAPLPAPSSPSGHHPPANVLDLPEGSGFAAELERIKAQARRAAGKLAEAEKTNDPVQIKQAEDAYDRTLERLREYERDAGKILSRDLVNADDYDNLVAEKLEIMKRTLRSLPVRIATLVALPPEWLQKFNEAYQSQLDKVFEHLSETDYEDRENLTLAAA